MIRTKVGAVYHYGIYVSDARVIAFGMPPTDLSAASDDVEVIATPIDIFAPSADVQVAFPDLRQFFCKKSRKATVSRAESRLGEKGYDILHNNCEHFAYECAYGIHFCTVEEEARRKWRQRPLLDVYISRDDGMTDPRKLLSLATERSFGKTDGRGEILMDGAPSRPHRLVKKKGSLIIAAVSDAVVSLSEDETMSFLNDEGASVSVPCVNGDSIDRLRVFAVNGESVKRVFPERM